VRLLEIVSGTKIGLDVTEYVAIFCRLIVLGNVFLGFVTLEFLSYTWIEKESGFQSCEWVLGFPIGVGNDYRYVFGDDYCYVVGKDWCCVLWDDGVDCLIVGWE
jgi:hypothetical protein